MIPEFNSFWHWLSWFLILFIVLVVVAGCLTHRKK